MGHNELISNDLLLLGSSNALKTRLDDWLSPHDWACRLAAGPTEADFATMVLPSLILIDGETARPQRTQWIAAVRTAESDFATTPILLLTDDPAHGQAGISATIPAPPARETMLAAIENWAGPLDDPGFRSFSNPHYRLIRMGGRAVADGMLARFADQLEQALGWLDHPEPGARLPHQIAGIAGMLGYRDISDHWRGIDAGDAYDAGAVRAVVQATIDRIRAA